MFWNFFDRSNKDKPLRNEWQSNYEQCEKLLNEKKKSERQRAWGIGTGVFLLATNTLIEAGLAYCAYNLINEGIDTLVENKNEDADKGMKYFNGMMEITLGAFSALAGTIVGISGVLGAYLGFSANTDTEDDNRVYTELSIKNRILLNEFFRENSTFIIDEHTTIKEAKAALMSIQASRVSESTSRMAYV